jgi:hypothetical protein
MALIQSKIPPQAYTRDTLVKAIEWLSIQPPIVRERANSADLIVSHYLQARRMTSAAPMEAPISQENFKADLRHLAEDLKRFEEPSAPPPQPTRSPSYIAPATMSAPAPMPVQQSLPLAAAMASAPIVSPPPAPVAAPPPLVPTGPVWAIDARSLTVAREMQDRLNLGSENEAIRMLITLGAERARALFPNS